MNAVEKSKLTKQQYRFASEMLWGCEPMDRVWAEETPIFKSNFNRFLEKYPMMDKSNFKIKRCKSFVIGNQKDGVVVIYIKPNWNKLIIDHTDEGKKLSISKKTLFDMHHKLRVKGVIYGYIFNYYNTEMNFTLATSLGWKFI